MEKGSIIDFQAYLKQEILPAVKELGKIKDEKSRKHLQKLAYTNIVNRFDVMIDGVLIDNCRSPFLVEKATASLTSPVSEAALIKLLLKGNDVEEALTAKLADSLRLSTLRERHSKKLQALFDLFEIGDKTWNHPRVNISTGRIMEQMKPTNKNIPYSVCGYADWLYSRRNALVHGAGKLSFLRNDRDQLKKLFKCEASKGFIIKISAVNNAAVFYENVAQQLIKAAT